MAELDFILQAVTAVNHADALQTLLALPNPTEILVSVAFVREPGLDAIEEAIKPLATRARFFIGIRNDITSIQAVKRLLAMKVELYAVDTGSRGILFHPKLYLAANAMQATILIGSANLTFGGLHNNIEASSRVNLDLTDAADKKFRIEVIDAFAAMLKAHPQHVFQIKDNQFADKLFESGRLADETLIPAPTTMSSIRTGERDTLSPMNLHQTVRPHIKHMLIKAAATSKPTKQGTPALVPIPTGLLVWKSNPLKRRDLSIPIPISRNNKKTNPTGSILLNQGAFHNIDQRVYFRNDVFDRLFWTKVGSPKRDHMESAFAKFEIVIKNINCGTFNLQLRHNTNTNTTSYKRSNSMTQLHWGDAKQYIAKDDLLDRILYLYRKDTTPPEFTIEID